MNCGLFFVNKEVECFTIVLHGDIVVQNSVFYCGQFSQKKSLVLVFIYKSRCMYLDIQWVILKSEII